MRHRTLMLGCVMALALGALAAGTRADIVHRYTFEGGNADDSVGTLDATTVQATIDTTTAQEGTYSADFDGSADYLEFTSTAFNGTAFSVAMWVRPNNVSTIQGLLTNKGGGTTAGFSMLLINDDLYMEAVDAADNGDSARADDVMGSGAWQHVCYVIDRANDTCRIYHDGADVTDDSDIQDSFVYGGTWRLGLLMDDGSDYNGRLDDVQIYNQVLTADDVAWLEANPGGVIPEPATVALVAAGFVGLAWKRRR